MHRQVSADQTQTSLGVKARGQREGAHFDPESAFSQESFLKSFVFVVLSKLVLGFHWPGLVLYILEMVSSTPKHRWNMSIIPLEQMSGGLQVEGAAWYHEGRFCNRKKKDSRTPTVNIM